MGYNETGVEVVGVVAALVVVVVVVNGDSEP